jgi:hypothetical protein
LDDGDENPENKQCMFAAENAYEDKSKDYYKSILEHLIEFGWYDSPVSAVYEGVDLSTS